MADNDSSPRGLTPSGGGNSTTNRGPLDKTIRSVPTPDTGDQDVRNLPSNGAIPDEVRSLIVDPGYHVPKHVETTYEDAKLHECRPL